jgi:hypothetical protein
MVHDEIRRTIGFFACREGVRDMHKWIMDTMSNHMTKGTLCNITEWRQIDLNGWFWEQIKYRPVLWNEWKRSSGNEMKDSFCQ